jgi:3-hydroxyacyl-CoA dehydrogenase
MHFFNPVRYMKLLELVRRPRHRPGGLRAHQALRRGRARQGHRVGKDTPNFVGNRIGAHAMMAAIHQMLADGLAPEDVDAIAAPRWAHPKSASFRTADLVGLDTFIHVADNCYNSLTDDEDREVFQVPAFIRTMIERKLLGDKTKGGFYKKGKEGVRHARPQTLEYREKGGDEAIPRPSRACEKVEEPASAA